MKTRDRVVEINGLSKDYPVSLRSFLRPGRGAGRPALEDVSFAFDGGEICCLLGLNGAGKTTLIKILAGLLDPDKGDARILGHGLRTGNRTVRQHIGLVNTNERSFYWRLSVRRNLLFFASLYGLTGKSASLRVDEVLAQVDMGGLGRQRFDRCSSGQKQKVSLGRALLAGPKVLLLDEPTSNIDIVAAKKLRRLIRTRLVDQEGMAALWCTHNLHEAQEVCDQVVVLHQGKVLADLSRQVLLRVERTASVFRLEVSGYRAGLPAVPGVSETLSTLEDNGRQVVRIQCAEDTVPAVLNRLVENRVRVFSCTRETQNLEEYFAALTGRQDEPCCATH